MPAVIARLLAGLFLLLSAPIMLVIAGAVLMAMGRPILFRQRRAGRGGMFDMMKFRTMRDAYDQQGNPLPDQARTTALGRFLRRSRLDELPELVNVLRGEMALVGPRPLLPETIAALGRQGELRCQALPGLTGWAQVNGNTLLATREKLQLDLWYVANRSTLLDLLILFRTVSVVIGGERRNARNLEKALASDCRRSG